MFLARTVSAITPNPVAQCSRCSSPLTPGALVCAQCQALVYQEQLDQLAARARAHEANGQLWDAHEQWQAALPLLPPNSKQAEWIRGHVRELETTIHAPGAPDTRKKWVRWLGPLAPIALLLAKFKGLFLIAFKLKSLLSFAAFLGIYWSLWGAKFGIGFAILILVHEMGHFIDIKRRGLPAEMPVFLPGLGAYVKWQAMGVPLTTRAAISLAGPLAGWFGAAICGYLWFQTGNAFWGALAGFTAWLNAINLIPVFILDGGQAMLAVSKPERAVVLAAAEPLTLALGQLTFLLVAAGALWRLFTRDEPSNPAPATTAYYVAVMAALGLVMWMMPTP